MDSPAPDGQQDARTPLVSPDLGEAGHVVDALIQERAIRLRKTPFWPMVRAVLYPILGYRKAVEMADRIAPLSGDETMRFVSEFLDMTAEVDGIENVPEQGPCVIVANHPGGITDGVVLWEKLLARRPDLCFFANRDALRVSPGLESLVIPVEWRVNERSRQRARDTLRTAIEAFKSERCIVIFPAGAMAEFSWLQRGLRERPWAVTAVSLARKFGTPVIPLGVRSRMSFWFYAFSQVSEELRNMTVFHELLAKKGANYELAFGAPIDPATLPKSEVEATHILRTTCEELAWPPE